MATTARYVGERLVERLRIDPPQSIQAVDGDQDARVAH
jgi:hypothetical protein